MIQKLLWRNGTFVNHTLVCTLSTTTITATTTNTTTDNQNRRYENAPQEQFDQYQLKIQFQIEYDEELRMTV
jgi:hypothetical protein